MNDSRIAPLSVDQAQAAAADAGVPDYVAELTIFQVLLRHPSLARGINDLLVTMMTKGALDPRLRELVIMRVAWLTTTDYEWTQHWRFATGLGVPPDDLLGVRDWPNYGGFGVTERTVLAVTDDIVRNGAVTTATWTSCEREFGGNPAVLIELVTAITAWRMIASILQSLGVPLEDGVASWPPDGQAPPIRAKLL